MLLEEDVQKWPRCDAFIGFYSTGYPLDKARAYAAKHNPFLINDLSQQVLLRDRREVYRVLKEKNIPVPKHVTVLGAEDRAPRAGEYTWTRSRPPLF